MNNIFVMGYRVLEKMLPFHFIHYEIMMIENDNHSRFYKYAADYNEQHDWWLNKYKRKQGPLYDCKYCSTCAWIKDHISVSALKQSSSAVEEKLKRLDHSQVGPSWTKLDQAGPSPRPNRVQSNLQPDYERWMATTIL